MIKLLWLAALAIVAWRLIVGRWPWESGKISSKQHSESQARALLGVSKNAPRTEILDAHRRLIARVHPDRGGTVDQVHEANSARDVLLAGLPGDTSGA